MSRVQEESKTVLLVDDDQVHRFMLAAMLKQWGWRCVEADDGDTAVAAVEKNNYRAVLMDIRMARIDGRQAFRRIHTLRPALPVLLMTAYSSVEDAVEMMKEGVYDYLTKPLDFERLQLALARAIDHGQVASRAQQAAVPASKQVSSAIIGDSPPVQELLAMVAQVAPTEATVLIHGESGTGKELVAEALHRNSARHNQPFIKVNCAALAESLLESELFGHEKGSFTGAERQRDGKFVQADSGTLFLDEIGETSPAMQVKLLRVLQEQELQRVGGEQTIRVDVRVLTATNRDLEEEVRRGAFREDLYYRLNVVLLEVPPLRARKGDIPLLVRHFVEKFAAKNRRTVDGITPQCLQLLASYPWPGNVRELENAIERGIILMQGTYLTEKSLPLAVQRFGEATTVPPAPAEESESLSSAEKRVILQTLEESGGNKSEASRRLGITRKTLNSKLNRYGIS